MLMANIVRRGCQIKKALLYSKLNREFHFTKVIDETRGLPLTQPMDKQLRGETTFCIPLLLNIEKWVTCAAMACRHKDTVIVLLVPSMTSREWFHRYICEKPGITVRFIEQNPFGDGSEVSEQNWMLLIFTNKRRKFCAESWAV